MTVLTYVAYAVAIRVWPGMAPHVVELYAASRGGDPGSALVWTLIILAAEESLWRGWLLRPLSRLVGRRGALALSLATYALAQVGSGSGILVLAALACGAIWLAERAWTGSVVAPLLSHAIWTPVIIHLVPLTVVHHG
jgi:membrane protease YdiL (CAAX protease family)